MDTLEAGNLISKFKVKEYNGQPVSIAQVKLDGHYAEVYKGAGGIRVYSKSRKADMWPRLQKIAKIKDQIENLPDHTILRCELYARGVQASSVPTLLNKADSRLLLSPFRIEQWSGDSSAMPFDVEFELLNKIFEVPAILDLSRWPRSMSDADVEGLIEKAVSQGIEGWVVRDIPGGGCWKVKPQKTVDAFVIGYKVSESEAYKGGLKSVSLAVFDGSNQIDIGSCGSGFETEFRRQVSLESLIGKIGEFKYQDVAAKGKLKFPSFIRWRDGEKVSEECTISQLYPATN